jgi:hypothetical protein
VYKAAERSFYPDFELLCVVRSQVTLKMDTTVPSSCSSVVSNTVANDATLELRRIHDLLAAKGVTLSRMQPAVLHHASTPLSPKRRVSNPINGEIRQRNRHQIPQQRLNPTLPSATFHQSSINASISSRSRSSSASTSTRRLQAKIQATLRSSKEMQSLLSRQYDLLEEANRQLASLGFQERTRFH